MAKRGRKKSQFSLTTGSDPALWLYDNVGDALAANRDILSQLIFVGTPKPQADDEEIEINESDEKQTVNET